MSLAQKMQVGSEGLLGDDNFRAYLLAQAKEGRKLPSEEWDASAFVLDMIELGFLPAPKSPTRSLEPEPHAWEHS